MNLSMMISQTLIYGDSLKNSVVAIVIPEERWAKEWAVQNDLRDVPLAELCENAKLKKEIETEITRLSNENKLSSLERPKGVHLSSVLFSVENDTLTPTFKLKRH